jgi:hypothetical protein
LSATQAGNAQNLNCALPASTFVASNSSQSKIAMVSCCVEKFWLKKISGGKKAPWQSSRPLPVRLTGQG